MIKSITRFFEEFMDPGEAVSNDEEFHSIEFATAALLMEVSRFDSRSDEGRTEVEKSAVLNILERLFGFSQTELSKLVELAEDASDEAHDLYSFTKLINEHYDYNAKKQLVTNLWEVAFADGRIDAFEEHIIRRISGLVHLANPDFIKAKITARQAKNL